MKGLSTTSPVVLYNSAMQEKDKLKNALKKYKKSSYYVRSWIEYEKEFRCLVEKITDYVKENKVTIDAVVPILRGGNIPATFLAFILDVLVILPVQYKYFFVKDKCELRRLMTISKDLIFRKDPTFLLIEGNHCYGNQARHAASDIKEAFPKCKIIYGASNMDYNYQHVVKDADVCFYGRLTNDCKELSVEECKKLGLEYKREPLFPWENVAEEWEIIELKQYPYKNLKKIMKKSVLVQEFDLS